MGNYKDDQNRMNSTRRNVLISGVVVILLVVLLQHSSKNTGPKVQGRASQTRKVVGANFRDKETHPGNDDEDVSQKNLAERIKKLESGSAKVREELDVYWQHTSVLDDSWGFDSNNKEGLLFMGGKIARAVKYGKPLVVSVIGSSVAAGHDNCQYDSMESQLERTLRTVFKDTGVDVVVRNAGEGGECKDTMENQVFCLRHMMGDDTDFSVYSWSYFETSKGLQVIHESFIRWSLMIEHAASPSLWYPHGCSDLKKEVDLFDRYSKYGYNINCMTRGVEKIGYKKGVTGLGKRVRRGSSSFWGAIGDGMHNVTRYGSNEPEPRRSSLGVMFRNWHPGPLGFQVSADAYAWRMLKATQEAIVLLKEAPESIEPKITKLSAQDLGENKCGLTGYRPYWAGNALCDHLPVCVNNELPTYGRPQVTYAKESDAANPFKETFSAKVDEYVAPANIKMIPREERSMPNEMCAHYDHCRGFHADFMTYKFPPISIGYIVVCFIQNKGSDASKLKYFINDKKIEETPFLMAKNKCHVLQKTWPEGEKTLQDKTFYLSIDMKDSPTPHVSHVFGL
eukprot:m.118482 g.118482  ORF g.118482 m.118482 type:complete len:566 (-) comp17208_c0_seq1:120-1817(-)